MYQETRYLVAGDSALVMEFGNEISTTVNEKVRTLSYVIEDEKPEGVSEVVPTYRSLMVHYDPLKADFNKMVKQLKELESKLENIELPPPVVTEIPTLYGGEYGPDLEMVAQHTNLTEKEVVEIHSAPEYLIYMLGFTPGFPYLGGTDQRISTPRLQQPRTKIRGGSVGIAGTQTGIYSIDSPGGWRLIGWTPVKLYDLKAENIFLLKAGNYVRFVPISEEEYEQIRENIENRSYKCVTYPREERGDDCARN